LILTGLRQSVHRSNHFFFRHTLLQQKSLRHLNRGYGAPLAALDRLELKDSYRRRPVFPASLLRDYRARTEGLQALANHDLLLVFAGREEQEAQRLGQLGKLNNLIACVVGPDSINGMAGDRTPAMPDLRVYSFSHLSQTAII
jgi:hypothetical protein